MNEAHSLTTPWQVVRATSREVVLELSSTAAQEGQGDGRVLCRVAAALADFGLEVCCDLVLWLDGTVLPWIFVQQSLLAMVPPGVGVVPCSSHPPVDRPAPLSLRTAAGVTVCR